MCLCSAAVFPSWFPVAGISAALGGSCCGFTNGRWAQATHDVKSLQLQRPVLRRFSGDLVEPKALSHLCLQLRS